MTAIASHVAQALSNGGSQNTKCNGLHSSIESICAETTADLWFHKSRITYRVIFGTEEKDRPFHQLICLPRGQRMS